MRSSTHNAWGRDLGRWGVGLLALGAIVPAGCTRELCEGGACEEVVGALSSSAPETPSSKASSTAVGVDTATVPTDTAVAADAAVPAATGSSGANPPKLPCESDLECTTAAPVCGEAHVCVVCEKDDHCDDPEFKFCDVVATAPERNRCIGCRVDEECEGLVCDSQEGRCAPCDSQTDMGCDAVGLEHCLGAPGDPMANECVGCVDSADCGPDAPACDLALHQCVPCLVADDPSSAEGCSNPEAPWCLTGEATAANLCVQCLGDADCVDSDGGQVCDLASHTCELCAPVMAGTLPPVADGGPSVEFELGCGSPGLNRCFVPMPQAPSSGSDAGKDAGQGADGTDGAADAEERTCVQCVSGADCEGVCDEASHACLECERDTNCSVPTRPQCNSEGSCEACDPAANLADGTNAACAHFEGRGVCNADGACVQCTGEFDAACGGNVCDVRPPPDGETSETQYTCTASGPHSTSVCRECVNDDQCQPGQVCVLTTFGSAKQPIGYFCLYRKVDQDMLNACEVPTDRDQCGVMSCKNDAPPYALAITLSHSVNGVTTDVCAPEQSTCPAILGFRKGTCETDADCGVPGVADAECVAWEDSKTCSPVCLTDVDCPVNGSGVTLGCDDGYCRTTSG